MDKKLRIGHLNIQGVKNKGEEITNAIKTKKLHILSLNETWGTTPQIKGFKKTEIKPRENAANKGRKVSGLTIYYHEELQIEETILPPINPSQTEILPLTLRDPATNRKLAYISLYQHPHQLLDTEYITQLIDLNPDILIGGDFNARHPDWGAPKSNQLGRQLKNFLLDEWCCTLPIHEPTYFPDNAKHSSAQLDHFVAPTHLINQYSRVEVSDEIRSDHRLITTGTDWGKALKREEEILDFGNANWDGYVKELQEIVDTTAIQTKEDTETAIQTLSHQIQQAIEKYVPKKTRTILPTLISPKTKELIQKRNKLRRLARRHWRPEEKRRINKLSKLIKESITIDREQHFRKLQATIQGTRGDPKKFWTAVKRLTGKAEKREIQLKDENNKLITDSKKNADIYAQYLEKACSMPTENPGTAITDNEIQQHRENNPGIYNQATPPPASANPEDQELLQDISTTEIEITIRAINPNKAPGQSGIKTLYIREGGHAVWNRLRQIMNACLKYGHFPKGWKHATVIPVPKPGKDPSRPENLRPISLLEASGKIFEKILAHRIEDYLERKKHFSDTQNGFRRGRETTDHLFPLSQAIARAYQEKTTLNAAFFDAEKAFDKTWTPGLLHKLKTNNTLPDLLLRLLADYFTQRTFEVRIHDQLSNPKRMEAGTPQGSPLSALLYILSTNDLKSNLQDQEKLGHNTTLQQLADDIGIYDRGKKKTSVRRLQQSTNGLLTYGKKWRIGFNPNKTAFLSFNSERQTKSKLKMNGTEIAEQDSTKYLGITYHRTGKFDQHVEEIVKKANMKLGTIKSLARNGIIDPIIILRLYQTYILPGLTYGAISWAGNITKKAKIKLERTQRKAVKIALNLPPWTPTWYIYERAKIKTMEETLKETSRRYLRRKNIQISTGGHRLKGYQFPASYAVGNPEPE